MQDEDGQILEAHSISAGLDYPGTGPEHAHLRDTGRARYEAVTDAQALAAFQRRGASSRASSRRSSPRTRSPGRSPPAAGRGRARPDLPLRPRGQGPGRGAARSAALEPRSSTGVERIAAAFAATNGPRRADAVPDGRLPRPRGVARRSARPTPTRGADLVELGVPFSDPLADGPVIHAAGTRALAAGRHAARRARARRARSPSASRWCSCATRTRPRARRRALRGRARPSADVSGLIVPDLPLEEAPAVLARLRRGRGRARAAGRADDARTTGWRAIGAQARGFVYTVSVTGTTGERADARRRRGRARAGQGPLDVPVALGFGISTPEHAAAAAAAGADGVIVGSRLVRAAAEGEDRAGAGRAASRRRSPGPTRKIPPRWGCSSPLCAGLVIWIVLWALGAKSFDAFMITRADGDRRAARCGSSRRTCRATAARVLAHDEPRLRRLAHDPHSGVRRVLPALRTRATRIAVRKPESPL